MPGGSAWPISSADLRSAATVPTTVSPFSTATQNSSGQASQGFPVWATVLLVVLGVGIAGAGAFAIYKAVKKKGRDDDGRFTFCGSALPYHRV